MTWPYQEKNKKYPAVEKARSTSLQAIVHVKNIKLPFSFLVYQIQSMTASGKHRVEKKEARRVVAGKECIYLFSNNKAWIQAG